MQRLLDTANEYNRQQGINTDYQIENYADIVEAIHVVQDEMGITGTTAAEAASTIQGSLSSVSAAWQNLVTGIADENADFGTLIDNFVESAATAMDNLLPRVKIALEGIGELVTELSPVIAEAIPELISDVLPSIVQSAVDLVTALVNALVSNSDMIVNAALDIVDILVDTLVDNAYTITDGAVSLITSLVNGISDRLPDLIPAAVQIILQIVKGLTDNIGAIISAAGTLVISIGAGLIEAIPDILYAPVAICTSIADGLVNYDWSAATQGMMNSLISSLDSAQKHVQVWLDNTFSGGAVYGGDIANVESTDFINNMRDGTDIIVSELSEAQKAIQTYYNDGKEILGQSQMDLAQSLEDSSNEFNEQAKKRSDELNKLIDESNKSISSSITTTGNEVADSTKKSGEKQKSVLAQSMEALERLYKQRNLTEDQYQKQRLEYLEKHRDEESDEWTKYYDSVQTYYEKLADTEQKSAEKAAQEREKNFKTIIDAYSKQVEQLRNKIDTFADKLTGAYKNFYTFTTKGDIYNEQLKSRQDSIDSLQREYNRLEKIYGENATAVISAKNRLEKAQQEYDDFQKKHDSSEDDKVISVQATDKMTQAGKRLEEYYNQLIKFQERGVGGDMISQLADFSQEEGLATLEYWNSLTDEQIKNLQAKYDKVTDLSSKVSELIHSDKAKSTAEAFADQISSAVENDEQFKEIGELMLSGIMEGLNNGAFDITEAASRISAAFNDYFQSGGEILPSGTVTSPSYAQAVTTATAFPIAETTSVSTAQQTAKVSAASESGIVVDVKVDIGNFNNYTNEDIDTLTDEIIIKIQDKINQRKVAFS